MKCVSIHLHHCQSNKILIKKCLARVSEEFFNEKVGDGVLSMNAALLDAWHWVILDGRWDI